jgi:hypothetical protein
MMRGETIAFTVAGILFAVFLANVLLGAFRFGAVLGDVVEMLALFGACVFFVIAVLGLERREIASGPKVSKQGGES